jgi:predicted enzyme related to lactoylglutathione lyase
VFAPFSEDTPEVQDEEGVGRFGWARDPEGNRIELWEPAAEVS